MKVTGCLGRLFKTALVLGGVVVVLALLGTVISNHRGKQAWNAYKAASAAKGETLEWRAAIPPEVPDTENVVKHPIFEDPTMLKETLSLSELPERSQARDARGHGWRAAQEREFARLFRKRRRRGEPAESYTEDEALEVFGAFVRERSALIDQYSEAVNRPECRLDLDYETHGPVPFELGETITIFRNAVFLLEWRALHALHNQQTSVALADISTMTKTARHAGKCPGTLSGVVGIVLWERSLQVLWEGLKNDLWSSEELIQLEKIFQAPDLTEELLRHLREERASFTYMVEAMIQGKLRPELEEAGLRANQLSWFPKGWLYRNLISYSEILDEFALAPEGQPATTLDPKRLEAMGDALGQRRFLTERLPIPNPHQLLATVSMPIFSKASLRTLQTEASLQLARLAIANQRHLEIHGTYATVLDELELADELRVFVRKQPVHYRIKEDGTPSLYLNGGNDQDDGGTPHKQPDKADWVWQYTYPEYESEAFED